MELISIIVPIYNAEKYLIKCLDSIIGQTYTELEIILVDDGSLDNSSEICRLYKKKDERIIYIRKSNEGVSSARNYGIDKANGEYLMFVDADDYLSLNMVMKLYEALKKNLCDMSVCGLYEDHNGVVRDKPMAWSGKVLDSRNEFSKSLSFWAPFCKLYKRDKILKDIRFPSLKLSEDLAFLSRVICENDNFQIAVVNESLYYYVIHDGSAMRSRYDIHFLQNVLTQADVKREFDRCGIDISCSAILRNAIEVFYYRYYSSAKRLQKQCVDDKRKVREIFKMNTSYLLSDKNQTNRRTMWIIKYLPILYKCYIEIKAR